MADPSAGHTAPRGTRARPSRASLVAAGLAALMVAWPVAAHLAAEPWYASLAARAAILALAGVGQEHR